MVDEGTCTLHRHSSTQVRCSKGCSACLSCTTGFAASCNQGIVGNQTEGGIGGLQVEFHRYLLQLRLARCPKGKGWLGRKLWKTKTFLSFCAGNTC